MSQKRFELYTHSVDEVDAVDEVDEVDEVHEAIPIPTCTFVRGGRLGCTSPLASQPVQAGILTRVQNLAFFTMIF